MIIDDINLKILNYLQTTEKINYNKLAAQVNLSNVAIKNRIKKLFSEGIIRKNLEINFEKFNLNLIMILLEIDELERESILKIYDNCPRIIYSLDLIGEYNFMLLVYSENLSMKNTIMKSCWLHNIHGIRKSSIHIAGDLETKKFFPINFKNIHTQKEISPCGCKCNECDRLLNHKCLACPATKYYNGNL